MQMEERNRQTNEGKTRRFSRCNPPSPYFIQVTSKEIPC